MGSLLLQLCARHPRTPTTRLCNVLSFLSTDKRHWLEYLIGKDTVKAHDGERSGEGCTLRGDNLDLRGQFQNLPESWNRQARREDHLAEVVGKGLHLVGSLLDVPGGAEFAHFGAE